jgi:hypothetical protein
MAQHHNLLPPASLRIRTRLPDTRCGFCGCREEPDATGRIIPIAHPKRAICELCIDYADEQTKAARLARRAPKAKRGPFRRINRHRIGA